MLNLNDIVLPSNRLVSLRLHSYHVVIYSGDGDVLIGQKRGVTNSQTYPDLSVTFEIIS